MTQRQKSCFFYVFLFYAFDRYWCIIGHEPIEYSLISHRIEIDRGDLRDYVRSIETAQSRSRKQTIYFSFSYCYVITSCSRSLLFCSRDFLRWYHNSTCCPKSSNPIYIRFSASQHYWIPCCVLSDSHHFLLLFFSSSPSEKTGEPNYCAGWSYDRCHSRLNITNVLSESDFLSYSSANGAIVCNDRSFNHGCLCDRLVPMDICNLDD